ncbi:unnamed protein product [Symbiodinium microadriaticum]|nr:unnamed protein product [Symbiodinium microadriaticum]
MEHADGGKILNLASWAERNGACTGGFSSEAPGACRPPLWLVAAVLCHEQEPPARSSTSGPTSERSEARATITSGDMTNATPAHWAGLANNAAGQRFLYHARADLRRSMVGMSVFQVACSHGAVDAMTEILAQVPSTDVRLGLHYALLFYGA